MAVDYGPVQGVGEVRGLATVEMPVLGHHYIVRMFEWPISEVYPFDTVVIPEIHLHKADKCTQ